MKTIEQVYEKFVEHRKSREMFDFWPDALFEFLTYETAEKFMSIEYLAKGENGWHQTPLTEETVIAIVKDYMEFAWNQVQNHRGISANRSVSKFKAWLWILESDLNLEDIQFENYGAPKLAAICEKYGFEIPESEAIKNMIKGNSCEKMCHEGCGG